MEAEINQTKITLACGDITAETTDAIVNAANERLAGGAGVDGAIHRAGGPAIMAQCRKIGGCPTGQAVITTGGNLQAKYVIHTVGPIYRGGTRNEAILLQSAYRESLKLALRHNLQSISFPAISTGVYGYPIDEAAHLALKTCIEFAEENTGIKLMRHILFDQRTYDIFSGEFKKLLF
ncbi:MAG: O-acetyl-ADP-ribose deacetylase [Deltaproteobacteria bacterium HGW-Deltaproteobacteria-12]|jgi:O-acetyl-ADP-ribose deacetylase (regulator of RNase III)|nr:MAG: O-acetyl-ADP-ribose deacetylase [Deltaproteobacteria bacterium HGW-Deltaproteobacteria-12]